jgi:hypothetical protein
MGNRAHQTRALLPSGTSCRSKPATYPRRPCRSRTARTIPTVPCPSCQTASRRYAHSHRRAHIKHLLCQSRPLNLRVLADGLGWRPPPPNPPDKPPALRYCPGETAEMAIRHPSAHSATSALLSAWLLPFDSTAAQGRRGRAPSQETHTSACRARLSSARPRPSSAWPGRSSFGAARARASFGACGCIIKRTGRSKPWLSPCPRTRACA